MARKTKKPQTSTQNILLVDDDLDYLQANHRLLEREGYNVVTAESGPKALEILQNQPVDLLLLDYFMPGMTGEEVVKELRLFNPYVQVVLQTGYASEKPPRELLRRLDIQGYYDKSDGPDNLLLWTEVGLKSAYTVQLLQKSRQGLQYILDVTPDMHKIQPLDDLLQGILWQVAGLLGVVNSFLAVLPEGGVLKSDQVESEGFLAMMDGAELIIRASTGRFEKTKDISAMLEKQTLTLVDETLQQGQIKIIESTTVVPLKIGELTIGVIYLDRPTVLEKDLELLQLFSNQAAVAIQNSQLYELATLDSLTGVYVRGFYEKMVMRELRIVFRSQQFLSFLMVDVDNMKQINDTAGHVAGDEALALVGKALRSVTRGSDVVGRYGGDEFAILLPQTPLEGAVRAGERILENLSDKFITGPKGEIPLRVSIGLGFLESHTFAPDDIMRPLTQDYFTSVYSSFVQTTDDALYKAKKDGGNQIHSGDSLTWPSFK